jgi:hypothetical protein
MARQLRRFLCMAAMVVCVASPAAGCLAQAPPAPNPDLTNPRHFAPRYLGLREPLGPDWLFAPTDSPAYASPAYDDRAWQTVSSDMPLSFYLTRDTPFVWYRTHVHFSRDARFLAIEVQYTRGSYELYANGVRIGANGSMTGIRESGQDYLTAYDVPDGLIGPNGDLVVAIRFALNRMGSEGVGVTTPFHMGSIFLAVKFGTAIDASYEIAHQTAIPWMLCGLNLLVGMVALALFLAMRNRMEYLAIALSLLASSLQVAVIIWTHTHAFTVQAGLLQTLALSITNVALIEFVRLILHLRRSGWLLGLEIANFFGYFGRTLFSLGLLSILPAETAYFLPALIVQAVLVVLLVRGLLRGNRDTRVILPAVAVVCVANYWNFLETAHTDWHWPLHIPAMPYLQLGSYGMDFWTMWAVIYAVTILLFLVLRTIGIARERARDAAELEAARMVQHVLIPEEVPPVPGFVLESAYKPAGEVGGDFFQIVPVNHGGVLIVIGDVSGKGMPAAMTVSLLVGTFRTLAHYTQSPGEILAAMNTRMLARSHGGFTTCLVLRADSGGTLTVANAGHIAPYVAGKELPLENGLPLGLAADATYPEFSFRFAPGQQVTLLTDGVIESRDKAGALFGFERSAALTTQPAEAIARKAQAFGQEDDITVLTLRYAGVEAFA